MIVQAMPYPAAAAPATDPHFADTVVLLSCDGTNGSTTFADESAVARGNATVTGNAQVTTTNPKFGSGALLLDGVGDIISYGDNANLEFSSNAFTLEWWGRYDASGIGAAAQTPLSKYVATGNARCWAVQLDATGTALQFFTSTNGSSNSTMLSGSFTPTPDQWYHHCIERSGNTWRAYIDGVMIASNNVGAYTLFNSAAGLRIGSLNNGSEAQFVKGAMDEIRITRAARYASDLGFSVPTAAFPRS